MIEIKRFIAKAKQQGDFEGCYYKKLDNKYYLVFAWNTTDDGKSLYGKIAYNCDDLQCDYDWDWYMPVDKESGDVIDTEITECENESVEELEREFRERYDWVKEV